MLMAMLPLLPPRLLTPPDVSSHQSCDLMCSHRPAFRLFAFVLGRHVYVRSMNSIAANKDIYSFSELTSVRWTFGHHFEPGYCALYVPASDVVCFSS